jgi:hypothetical protein
MRKLVLLAAVTLSVLLLTVDTASARGRGGRGGSCGSSGGYCYSGYSSCGYGYGGHGYGGCGYGGYGYGGYCSTPYYSHCYSAAPMMAPVTPMSTPMPTPMKTGFLTTAPITLVVHLPADAKLTVDDHVTASKSSQRVFTSPAVQLGRDYHSTPSRPRLSATASR